MDKISSSLWVIVAFLCVSILPIPDGYSQNCIQFEKDTSMLYCNNGAGWIPHKWWTADSAFTATSIEVQSTVANSDTYIRITVNSTTIAEWYADVGTDIHSEAVSANINPGDEINFYHGNDSYGCVTGPIYVKFCAPDGPILTVNPTSFSESELSVITSFDGPGSRSVGIASDGQQLYISDNINKKIYTIDTSGALLASFDAPSATTPKSLEYDGSTLWYAESDHDKIYQVDTSGSVIQSFDAPGTVASGIAYDGESLWHVDYYDDFLYKLDTSGNILSQAPLTGNMYGGLAYDGSFLWLLRDDISKIYRIDSNGNQIGPSYDCPSEKTSALSFDGKDLWCADWSENVIYKLDIPNAVPVGGTRSETFTITNKGNQSLNITHVGFSGDDAGCFNVTNNTCTGNPTAPSGTCTFDLNFSPLSKGYKTATLEITSDDPSTPVKEIGLEGNTFYYLASPDLYDAIYVLKLLSGVQPDGSHNATDINGDDQLGIEEVVYILKTISGT